MEPNLDAVVEDLNRLGQSVQRSAEDGFPSISAHPGWMGKWSGCAAAV